MKIILALTEREAFNFCYEQRFSPNEAYVARSVQSLEGLRFRYEDVIRLPGWSKRPDIEEIEDRILRKHITMSPR